MSSTLISIRQFPFGIGSYHCKSSLSLLSDSTTVCPFPPLSFDSFFGTIGRTDFYVLSYALRYSFGGTPTPAPSPDDSVYATVTVDGKKYSGKLNME